MGAMRSHVPTEPRSDGSAATSHDRSTDLSQPSLAPEDLGSVLPGDDPFLAAGGYDLVALRSHWAATAARPPMTAEAMRGADARAQRQGISGGWLMEQAGAAVAAAARALLETTGRSGHGPVLIVAGPGNNGGDGFVAARVLARAGLRVVVALVGSEPRPSTPDALANWQRLDGEALVERIHAATPHAVNVLLSGLERASLAVDALLGTGVAGPLREPIRSAVDLVARARAAGVPVLAVDTPTAVDLTSGAASDPVVRADVTVTFHRPKTGLRSDPGRALAGRVLVAPIGIPPGADPA